MAFEMYQSTGTNKGYDIPKYDWDKLREYTQAGMTGMGKLRSAYSSGLSQISNIDNPAARNQAYRSLLGGYGSGVSSLYSGAQKTAQSMYQPEYEATLQSAYDTWQAEQKEKETSNTLSAAAERGKHDEGTTFWNKYTNSYDVGTKPKATQPTTQTAAQSRGVAFPTYSSTSDKIWAQPASWEKSYPSETIYGAGSYEKYLEAMGYPSSSERTY